MLFCTYLGLFFGCVGLFGGYVGLFCVYIERSCAFLGLFCRFIGLFCVLCYMSYVISCTISFRCKIRLCCRHITVLETAEICTLNRALLRKYTALLRKFMHIHSTGPQNRTGEGSFAEDMYIE